jgi:hypothetical protein
MKQFMLFIRKRKNSSDTVSPEKHEMFLRGCEDYIGKLKRQGNLISAQPIEWQGAILARTKDGWNETSYADSAEIIGGYYLIRADDLEEAIALAKENPEFQYNPETRIEVRPIKSMEETTGFVYPTT